MTDEPRIYIGDLRRAGKCVSGVRTWFGAHGLSFSKFLAEGITERELAATGDHLAQEVIDRKNGR